MPNFVSANNSETSGSVVNLDLVTSIKKYDEYKGETDEILFFGIKFTFDKSNTVVWPYREESSRDREFKELSKHLHFATKE